MKKLIIILSIFLSAFVYAERYYEICPNTKDCGILAYEYLEKLYPGDPVGSDNIILGNGEPVFPGDSIACYNCDARIFFGENWVVIND